MRHSRLLLPILAALLVGSCSEGPVTVFEDAAGAWGLDHVHDNGMSGRLYFVENLGPGVGLLDYDGDGDLDVYLPQGRLLGPGPDAGGEGDRLYRNDGSGGARRLVDVTERAGIRATGYGMGVAAGDVDGDGDVDLYVVNYGPNQLWINDGDGSFHDGTELAGVGEPHLGTSASLADLDGDGRLDLYVVNYVDYRLANARPCLTAAGAPDYCGPQGFDPVPDRLYLNLGGGRFEDVTAAAGVRSVVGKGLGVVSGDFDGDGATDLYVTNDLMPNFLWTNRGDGTFEERAAMLGVAVNAMGVAEASMGVVADDFDNDLDPDLFVTHLDGETDTLYRNLGGHFEDASDVSGVGRPSWRNTGFGVLALDYDQDGWLDLLTVNGAIRLIEEQRRAGIPHPLRQPDQLLRNEGGGRFVVVDPEVAGLGDPQVGRGGAVGDLDNDGAPDAIVCNNSGPVRVLLSRKGGADRWIGLAPAPTAARAGLAGRTALLTGPSAPAVARRFHTDGSYASARDPRVLFGTGERAGAFDVAIDDSRRFRALAPGHYYVVPERRPR